MPRIPVNSDTLGWALDDAGVSVREVAELTGRPLAVAQAWLSPEGPRPLKGDLQIIAKRVGRSLQFFLLPSPPTPSSTTTRFRSAVTGSSQTPSTELRAIRQAGGIQKLTRWASENVGLTVTPLPRPSDDAIAYANEMRAFIPWTLQNQVNATSKSAAFKALRSHIETLGIAVLYLDAGLNNCRGFSLPDDIAPLIVLNSAYSLASLKSFTLVHELAHIAAGTAAVCHDPHSDEEKWCDEFASAFLLPENHLRNYFAYKHWTSVAVHQIDDRVRLISNRYNASWQAVVVRLRQLGLTDQGTVDAVFAHSGEVSTGFDPNSTRTRPTIRLDQYGKIFTKSIVALRGANKLSEFDARQQLNVDGADFEQLKLLLSGRA
jgi:Zn-dependent peptidase ImmA (M78 family)